MVQTARAHGFVLMLVEVALSNSCNVVQGFDGSWIAGEMELCDVIKAY